MQYFQGRKKAKRAHLMTTLRVRQEVGSWPNKRAWEHILDILDSSQPLYNLRTWRKKRAKRVRSTWGWGVGYASETSKKLVSSSLRILFVRSTIE